MVPILNILTIIISVGSALLISYLNRVDIKSTNVFLVNQFTEFIKETEKIRDEDRKTLHKTFEKLEESHTYIKKLLTKLNIT